MTVLRNKVVLVTGGRNFNYAGFIEKKLDECKPKLIVVGGAKGVDTIVEKWCMKNGIACAVFPAPWKRFGRMAGKIRNEWMIRFMKIDFVLAFPGGRGTRDMIKKAREDNILVVVIDYE